jgi:perosamine synthetase
MEPSARALGQKGIETRPFFYPVHILPPYKRRVRLPVAENLSANGLNLPSGPKLSESQIQRVAEELEEALVKRARTELIEI